MLKDELKQLGDSARERNKTVYAWLRWLILLASGAFAILASLLSSAEHTGMARIFLNISWVSLGSGILLGAVAIYGEACLARRIVKDHADEIERQLTSGDPRPRLGISELPRRFIYSEKLCYVCLLLFVVCFVIFAIIKT